MTLDEVMSALEAAGTAQTRKTYLRHGMPEPLFGVLTGALTTLRKRIKVDHTLAGALWASGNGDARSLATMVADPKAITRAELDQWAAALTWHGHAGYLADLVHRTPHAAEAAADWTRASAPGTARAGWTLLTLAATREDTVPDDAFLPTLARVEAEVHAAENRVKEAMMGTLIAIGGRSDALAELAIAAADRIGTVTIDHGDTDCRTPVPEPYIRKMRAHRLAKAARKGA